LERFGLTEALTTSNIQSGWKASGLWPVNMAKPLMSRLLLDQGNNSFNHPKNRSDREIRPKTPSKQVLGFSEASWITPRKAIELRSQLDQYTRLGNGDSTQRLLFKKVNKGFDEKAAQLAQAQIRIQQLEAQVEAIRPTKRRKVVMSPKFVNIEAIAKTQGTSDKLENKPLNRSENAIDEESCIIVS
jgi:hypothetical protein